VEGFFVQAIVFANGKIPGVDAQPVAVPPGSLVIAADGGARLCRALGLVPNVVVGDCDSLDPAELAELVAAGVEVVRHPARKDHTDLDLALQLAAARGAGEALVYGALGLRWDMTLANMLLAVAPHLGGLRVGLIDGAQTLWPLRGGQSLTLTGQPGDVVSLIPVGGAAVGVTAVGLAWVLADDTLAFGSTRGVSNELVGEQATVRLRQGFLICVHVRRSG
jgi:thiamine pyrophosphokinase